MTDRGGGIRWLLLVLPIVATTIGCRDSEWRPADVPLVTRWAQDVDPSQPHPEYPRPIMRRHQWHSLNGLWDYALVSRDLSPDAYDGKILVPFPIEAALSGVGDTVGISRSLWYRREFEVPGEWSGKRILLHFEAVDWETLVWLNGQRVGDHRGGYDPFTFEITGLLAPRGPQELTVAVWDPTDAGTQARGKQVRDPGGIFYTSVTGIWQTVWLEPVPQAAITDMVVVSDIGAGDVTVTVVGDGLQSGDRVRVSVLADGQVIGTASGAIEIPIDVRVPEPRLWSPDDPFLYDLRIGLLRDGAVVDEVESYFGMRSISVGKDAAGIARLLLNSRFVFQSGPLDQGYWPDGLYAAPAVAAMVYDLEMIQAMGFNMLRKHVKVEPRTFYSWCDRLGILVWQDMPNANIPLESRGSDVATDTVATAQFEAELRRLVVSHRNHPSIVMWVPFNEGWGQYDTERVVELVRELDPTRLVNQASGWIDRGFGNVVDRHSYPAPNPPQPEGRRAAVLGEFGGLGFNVAGHMWTSEGWGYDLFPDRESLTREFEGFMTQIHEAVSERGLSAAVYTQTTDIETENNGLLTYDRAVAKIDTEAVALANRGYLPPRAVNRAPIFVDHVAVVLQAPNEEVTVRYTTDGTEPTETASRYGSPFQISETTTIRARSYWVDGNSSRAASFTLTKVDPLPAYSVSDLMPGLRLEFYEQNGGWSSLPDFDVLTPNLVQQVDAIGLDSVSRDEFFGLRFLGYIDVPQTGVYGFFVTSDDGSRLLIDGNEVVDNDGIHGEREKSGFIALEAGKHELSLSFFQGAGGVALGLRCEGPGFEEQKIPPEILFHRR
ncbi:MAG: chitobiase/beta-hexosaminidase C-terminal domain-containing protein [Gemmatimonadota bacterium]|nr:MAG: chitobiase/beta-hexosaminidase C-terminal domain-containing protein [Gemmatimonadota bacterium]